MAYESLRFSPERNPLLAHAVVRRLNIRSATPPWASSRRRDHGRAPGNVRARTVSCSVAARRRTTA